MVGRSGLGNRLKSLDTHSSISNEFRVRTGYGALLSLITTLSIFFLIRSEFVYNLKKETISKVYVNATSPTGLQVEFDISFPKIPCALISVDAADPTGQAQSLHIDKIHRIYKHRLDGDGKTIGRRSSYEIGNTLTDEAEFESLLKETVDKQREKEYDDEIGDEELCGSCYGAGDEDECCNTCDDVKRAYQRKGWHLEDLNLINQCKHIKQSKEETGEGCNLSGKIALGTGGGNLHFVPGRSLEQFGHEKELSFADVLTSAFETYNVTHKINKLRFGRHHPGIQYPLDKVERVIEDNHGMYQYYLQIVPSSYQSFNGQHYGRNKVQTFQYAVTEHLRHVSPGSNRGMPGVYFFYEVSPLHVEVSEVRRGWIHFFTSVCAVVGGTFTMMSMVDKLVYHVTEGKAIELG